MGIVVDVDKDVRVETDEIVEVVDDTTVVDERFGTPLEDTVVFRVFNVGVGTGDRSLEGKIEGIGGTSALVVSTSLLSSDDSVVI
jgi:hypothetical protein